MREEVFAFEYTLKVLNQIKKIYIKNADVENYS